MVGQALGPVNVALNTRVLGSNCPHGQAYKPEGFNRSPFCPFGNGKRLTLLVRGSALQREGWAPRIGTAVQEGRWT
jgi:hypothetical protein